MGTGCSNYPSSGDRKVTALKKPDASQYVSRAIYPGKRPMATAQVASRIASLKTAVSKIAIQASTNEGLSGKKALEPVSH